MKNKRLSLLLVLFLCLAIKSSLVLSNSTICDGGELEENMLNDKVGRNDSSLLGAEKTIDGSDKDWLSNKAYSDAKEAEMFPVDYQTAWFQQDNERIYIAYRNRTPIDENKLDAWYVYIDSDVDADTGYRINNLGADFLLEGDNLFKHSGSTDQWQWKKIGQVESGVEGKFAEFAIDRIGFSEDRQFKLLFYGANMGKSGGLNDTFPISINLSGSSRVVDGSSNDWPANSSYQEDEKSNNSPVDFTKGWFHRDNEKVYLAYHNRIPIDPNQLWAWHVFIDKDAQSSTGFQSSNLGADFLLEGKTLFEYSGNGKDWVWQRLGEVEAALSGHFAEFALNQSVIKPSKDVKLLFYGSNAGGQGMTNDSLFASINGSFEGLVRNSDWIASKHFQDEKEAKSSPVDFLSARFFQDSDKIYLSYCNRSKIDTDKWWAWHVYIDSDRQAATGYQYDGIGADFILEGNTLFKYTGSPEKKWQWEVITEVESNINAGFAEFSIDKKLFNQSDQYQFVLFGANSSFGEGENDRLKVIP